MPNLCWPLCANYIAIALKSPGSRCPMPSPRICGIPQGCESRIVNTASVVGLLSHNPYAPYHVSKHAVVALTENLQYALQQAGTLVSAGVLCPGWTNTRLMDVARYETAASNDIETATTRQMRQAAAAGISPGHVAECVFNGIRAGQFYIFTGDDVDARIRERMENILGRHNP